MFESSFRLGSIAGIRIGINTSLLFIAGLISFSLATTYFPSRLPQESVFLYWLLAAVAAAIFFFSILWHEMAHALTARLFGLPVRGIVLNIIGGMAFIEKEPENAKQTFWFAFAGPLSSAVFGAAMLLGAWALGTDSTLGVMLLWLGEVNLFLAAVNMLPGLPLDGGHVLLAVIWFFTRDQIRATRIAAKVGQSMAALLVLLGMLQMFLMGSLFVGLWSVFIGWFMWSAASSRLQFARLQFALRDLQVRNVIDGQQLRLHSDWSIVYALDMMSLNGARRSAPVVQNDEMVGVFSMETVLRLPRFSWGHLRVGQLMRSLVGMPTVNVNDDLLETLRQMEVDDVDYAIVTNDQTGDPITVVGRQELLIFAEHQRRSAQFA